MRKERLYEAIDFVYVYRDFPHIDKDGFTKFGLAHRLEKGEVVFIMAEPIYQRNLGERFAQTLTSVGIVWIRDSMNCRFKRLHEPKPQKAQVRDV